MLIQIMIIVTCWHIMQFIEPSCCCKIAQAKLSMEKFHIPHDKIGHGYHLLIFKYGPPIKIAMNFKQNSIFEMLDFCLCFLFCYLIQSTAPVMQDFYRNNTPPCTTADNKKCCTVPYYNYFDKTHLQFCFMNICIYFWSQSFGNQENIKQLDNGFGTQTLNVCTDRAM